MRKRLPASFYNTTTLIGGTIAILMLVLIIFLIILDSWRGFTNPYMGLITYIALPAAMLFGLVVAFVGVVRTRRRLAKDPDVPRYPTIDLNNPRVRRFATWFAVLGIIVMALSGFSTYEAYEYTESVKFCGETCHGVMGPEYATYKRSPHAEVGCKTCHIGPGAESYVQSKLAGTKQLYALLSNTVEKPIPTPIGSMQSTVDTCERCHWSGKRFSPKMNTRIHYLNDETNTPYQISMLVKVGATEPGKEEGIHAHMYLNNEVRYVATDPQRQVIPYVEMRDKEGNLVVYRDKENPISDEALKTAKKHVVNCADCHNRPAHEFLHPDAALSDAFTRKKIDATLPELKTIASEVLEKPYKKHSEAMREIPKAMLKFYEESYPDALNTRRPAIDRAIAEVVRIYSENYFPEMKADWKAHPDNLDHIHSNGCFRCHDDKHVSPKGRVISKNCQTCHLIVAQGKPGEGIPTKLQGQEFKHPQDIGDSWKDTPCKDCHGKSEE